MKILLRWFVLSGLVLAGGAARAETSLSLGATAPCSGTRDVGYARSPGRSACGVGAGLRALTFRDAAALAVGVDLSYARLDRRKAFDGKGGNLVLGQVLVRYRARGDGLRPYAQIGAGLFHADRHSKEHPVDLMASGAVGIEGGAEGYFWGLEVGAAHLALDDGRFGRRSALLWTPGVRVGWRYR